MYLNTYVSVYIFLQHVYMVYVNIHIYEYIYICIYVQIGANCFNPALYCDVVVLKGVHFRSHVRRGRPYHLKKGRFPRLYCYLLMKLPTKRTSWWFQPLRNIFVKNRNLPQLGVKMKKYLSCHHPEKVFLLSHQSPTSKS